MTLKYEMHLARKAGTSSTPDPQEQARVWKLRASDSVEHIFPQPPGAVAAWRGKMRIAGGPEQSIQAHVGRIGNLVLLPIALNQDAQARPFDEKKAIYQRHNLRMLAEVCAESDWTLANIEAREAHILDWAEMQWADV